MDADGRDRPSSPAGPKENLVVRLAVGVLAGKGSIDEPDDALIADLRRLYRAILVCQRPVSFGGELRHDLLAARPGEHLAAAWEQEQQDHPERHRAERWSCRCGTTFGLYPLSSARVAFHTLANEGVFLDQAADCSVCGRDLAVTGENTPAGQLGLPL